MTSQHRNVNNKTPQNDTHDFVRNATENVHATTLNMTSSPGRRDNDNNNDVNATLLWLPYVVFAIVLLCLIALSFVRFHYKRGLQYKLRQVELDRKRRGGSTSEAEVEVSRTLLRSSSVFYNEGIDSQYDFLPEVNIIGRDDGRTRNGRPATAIRLVGNGNLTFVDEKLASAENSRDMQRRRQQQQRRRANNTGNGGDQRRPIVFTFNANGSMVDVRCCEDDDGDERFVNNTFRFSGNGNPDDSDATPVSVIDLEKAAAAEVEETAQNGSRLISGENRRHHPDRRQRRWDGKSNDPLSHTAVASPSMIGGHCNSKNGSAGATRFTRSSPQPNRFDTAAAAAVSVTSPEHCQYLHPSANGYHSPHRQSVYGGNRVEFSKQRLQHQQQHHQQAQLPIHGVSNRTLLSPHRQHARGRHRHLYHHQFNHSHTLHRDLAGTPLFHASLCGLGSGSSDEEIRRDSVAAEALQLWQKRV